MQYKIKNTAIKAKVIVTKHTHKLRKLHAINSKNTLATLKIKQNKLYKMKLTKRKKILAALSSSIL